MSLRRTSLTNKTVIQTSVNKPSDEHIKSLMVNAPGWKYVHFDDSEILKFFKSNPISEFKDIEKKFRDIRRGEHRADLFRYYYIYLNGGFFVDFDFELLKDINDVVKDYNFVSASIDNTSKAILDTTKRSRTFNGYMYADKKHPIVLAALRHLYSLDILNLGPLDGSWDSRYHIVCETLYHIITLEKDKKGIKIYEHTDGPSGSFVLDGGTELGRHRGSPKDGYVYTDPLLSMHEDFSNEDFVLLFCQETLECQLNSGIQRYTRKLAKSLLEAGIRVVPVTLKEPGGQLSLANAKQLDIFSWYNGPQISSWPKELGSNDISYFMNRASRIIYPELPNNLGSDNLNRVFSAARSNKLKIVSVFHDAIAYILKDYYSVAAQRNFLKYMQELSASDMIVAVSESSKVDYERYIRKPKNPRLKVSSILLPHDIDVSNICSPKNNDTKEINILCVSAFEKRKNHIGLVKAFRNARRKASAQGYSLNLTFIAAYESSDTVFMGKIKQVCDQSGIKIKVNVSEEELEQSYADADFTVYPSVYEGYGLPIVESLSRNTPVICSNTSSMKELADQLGGVKTFDPNDIKTLSDQIILLATKPRERSQLIKEISQISHDSWKNYAEKFINTL